MTTTNPVRAMIARLQTLISCMDKLGNDPMVLTYFIDAVDVMVDDIRDEVLEVVNAYIPAEDQDEVIDPPPSE
jgi:hypothetical protein